MRFAALLISLCFSPPPVPIAFSLLRTAEGGTLQSPFRPSKEPVVNNMF
jgi:hypothetical protein